MSENVIIRPIITEKSLIDAKNGIFTFAVEGKATKFQIKKAIESMFSVHVKLITTVKTKGKKRTVGRKRLTVYKPDLKKARVKLAKDEKIDLFEVGEGK
ncbi:50S ribosomal protein L23 [Patescibacteria group bacterium]|nr:50S ribosomal protein L23 [Patescibacteria group bacterium]MCL5797243.1 50S ribosomal protein L23 [Patescibacteria group bacterium]